MLYAKCTSGRAQASTKSSDEQPEQPGCSALNIGPMDRDPSRGRLSKAEKLPGETVPEAEGEEEHGLTPESGPGFDDDADEAEVPE